MYKKICAALFPAVLAAAVLPAQNTVLFQPAVRADGTPVFQLSAAADVPLSAGVSVFAGTMFCLDKLADVHRTEFSGTAAGLPAVNGFDGMAVCPYSETLDTAGTCLLAATCLAPAVLLAAPRSEWFTVGTMYAETMLLAYGVKELGKQCVTRPRPYMYYSGYPASAAGDGDWCRSFPSGHTTLAFAAAAFTSCTFSLLFPDSDLKIPVIAVSYTLAAGVAALRIAGGCHFLTDVLAGAAIGTACGFLVPWLHTKVKGMAQAAGSRADDVSLTVTPLGASLAVRF